MGTFIVMKSFFITLAAADCPSEESVPFDTDITCTSDDHAEFSLWWYGRPGESCDSVCDRVLEIAGEEAECSNLLAHEMTIWPYEASINSDPILPYVQPLVENLANECFLNYTQDFQCTANYTDTTFDNYNDTYSYTNGCDGVKTYNHYKLTDVADTRTDPDEELNWYQNDDAEEYDWAPGFDENLKIYALWTNITAEVCEDDVDCTLSPSNARRAQGRFLDNLGNPPATPPATSSYNCTAGWSGAPEADSDLSFRRMCRCSAKGETGKDSWIQRPFCSETSSTETDTAIVSPDGDKETATVSPDTVQDTASDEDAEVSPDGDDEVSAEETLTAASPSSTDDDGGAAAASLIACTLLLA